MNRADILKELHKSADYRCFDTERKNRSYDLYVAAAKWIEEEYGEPYSSTGNPEEIPFAYTTYGDDEDDVQVYVDAVHLEFIFELNGYDRVWQSVEAEDIPYVDFSEITAEAYDILSSEKEAVDAEDSI